MFCKCGCGRVYDISDQFINEFEGYVVTECPRCGASNFIAKQNIFRAMAEEDKQNNLRQRKS